MLSTLWHLLRTLMEPPSSYMPHLMSWIKQMDQTVRNQVTQLHGETLTSHPSPQSDAPLEGPPNCPVPSGSLMWEKRLRKRLLWISH